MAGAGAPAPRTYPPACVAIATAARAERNPLLANGARKGATSMSMPSAVCIGALLVTAGAAAVGASVLAAHAHARARACACAQTSIQGQLWLVARMSRL